MTKAEAIQAMKSGKKVTHRYFSSNEYIGMNEGKIYEENGYTFEPNVFWMFKTDEAFNTDWSLFEA